MLSIGIRYLCGWAMATHPADRERPEWPPHPDRVFMALATAHFETDGGADEYAALKHLAGLGSPEITASPAHHRQTVTAFVPVNDDSSPISKKGKPLTPTGSMPVGRDRQPRSFPVAVPESDTVFLTWPRAELAQPQRQALGALCRKVSAVGHSASLVQVWVEDEPPGASLRPSDRPGACHRLRVPWSGRLEELQGRFEAGLHPSTSGWQGYDKAQEERIEQRIPGTVFAPDLIVLRQTDGPLLGLESTLVLTDTLRKTTIAKCPEPVPEWVSGHEGKDGPPSQLPHLAFIPLPNVGHAHGDGRLLGAALAVPAEVEPEQQRRCFAPLLFDNRGHNQSIRLTLGPLGAWEITRDDREDRPVSLRPEVWTGTGAGSWGPATQWATVTPVVLDRYPKAALDAEQILRLACVRIGLPEPVEVVTTGAPAFVGVPHARRYPPLNYGQNGGNRFHTHALLRFAEPVRGPVLIGAGRYRGYGFCRPWREGR
jgi:CRISPR-associated protein Csb2